MAGLLAGLVSGLNPFNNSISGNRECVPQWDAFLKRLILDLQLGSVPLSSLRIATPSHCSDSTGRTATTDASNAATVAPDHSIGRCRMKSRRLDARQALSQDISQPGWPIRKPAGPPPTRRRAPRCGQPGRHTCDQLSTEAVLRLTKGGRKQESSTGHRPPQPNQRPVPTEPARIARNQRPLLRTAPVPPEPRQKRNQRPAHGPVNCRPGGLSAGCQ